MFRTKTFAEITASMLGHARAVQRRISDWNVGSVARTMLEAPASEIDQLYQEMAQGLVEAIPTAVYRSFDFDLLDARHATGVLRFTARGGHNTPIVIPVGFLVSTANGQRYQTAEAGSIPVGETMAEVLASALAPGAAGNVSAGAVTRVISSGAGLAVTNPLAFENGRGKETESERKLRFVEFVRTLARGTTASLSYIAKLAALTDPRTGVAIERVVRAVVSETTGHVDLFIHNGAGNTSAALVARTQQLVDGADGVSGYRPAGMRVDVVAMEEIPVAVAITAEVASTHRTEALRQAIIRSIEAAIRAVPSEGRLRPLDLINAALALDPVLGATIEAPTLTVQNPAGAVLVPGSITVTWR